MLVKVNISYTINKIIKKGEFMKKGFILLMMVGILSTMLNANTWYDKCYKYCDKKSGKIHKKQTIAGACEKGCSLRNWQGEKQAKQGCSDKYSNGDLYNACLNGVNF